MATTLGWQERRLGMILLGIGLSLSVSFLAWVIFAASWKTGLVRALATTLIYALPMIFLSALLMPTFERYIDPLPIPWDWVVFFPALLVMSAITITVSSGLMVLAHMVSPMNPWPELKLVNRLVLLSVLVFSGGGRLLRTTQARLEKRNRALEEQIAAEAQAHQVQTQDIERAWEIQQGLFPKQLPSLPAGAVAAGCQPARVVGGDYFDVIRLGENRVAVAIADVVGKGMAAALLMSNLQAIIRSFVPTGLMPAELCAKANEVIAGNIAPGKFITFFCAVVDTERMVVEYCNAGHNPPLLVRSTGRVEKLEEGGPLLGVFPNATYASGTARLSDGDALVLYTDGVTEAESAAPEEFGEARLVQAVRHAQSDGAEAVRQSVVRAVREFAGDSLQDDATLVIFTAAAHKAGAAQA